MEFYTVRYRKILAFINAQFMTPLVQIYNPSEARNYRKCEEKQRGL